MFSTYHHDLLGDNSTIKLHYVFRASKHDMRTSNIRKQLHITKQCDISNAIYVGSLLPDITIPQWPNVCGRLREVFEAVWRRIWLALLHTVWDLLGKFSEGYNILYAGRLLLSFWEIFAEKTTRQNQ